jgi:lipoprotein-releasing system ATP-binding protein
MSDSILSCQQLSRSYTDGKSKIDVLKGIDLAVAQGEMVAIVGSSGSGKSTLLHLLAGLDKPTSGAVMIRDKNIHQVNEDERCYIRNHSLGFIYQFHHLLPEFTALENVGMPLLIRDAEPEVITSRAKELLTQVGLKDRLNHKLGALSGGERQRVAIARALVAEPACILADEPTGNLDPSNAARVLDMFFALQKEQKTSVVMVTHDRKIAGRADRVFEIVDGSLLPA